MQDLDSVNGALSKAKSQLQIQVDDYKTKLEEETRVSSNCRTTSIPIRTDTVFDIPKHLAVFPAWSLKEMPSTISTNYYMFIRVEM